MTNHATRKFGNIDVEGELLSGELEHLVLLLVLRKEIDTRRSNASVRPEELKVESRALGLDSVVRVVRDWLQNAVLCACLLIGADIDWGSLSPVSAALCGVILLVHGMGKGVKDDVVGLLDTSPLVGAGVGGDLGMSLLCTLGVGCLSRNEAQAERDEEEPRGRCHFDCLEDN